MLPDGRDGNALCRFASEQAAKVWAESCPRMLDEPPAILPSRSDQRVHRSLTFCSVLVRGNTGGCRRPVPPALRRNRSPGYRQRVVRLRSSYGIGLLSDTHGGGANVLQIQRQLQARNFQGQITVVHWPEYDAALIHRGSITVRFTEEAVAAWHAPATGALGGQPLYWVIAVETGLALRLMFHRSLRQTEDIPLPLMLRKPIRRYARCRKRRDVCDRFLMISGLDQNRIMISGSDFSIYRENDSGPHAELIGPIIHFTRDVSRNIKLGRPDRYPAAHRSHPRCHA